MAYAGHYNDGQSAARHDVEVYLWGEDLKVRSRDRQIDLQWGGADLRLNEEAYSGKPVRLTHRAYEDAVVTVADPAFLETLIETHPRFARKVMRGSTLQRVAMWSGITLATIGLMIFGMPPLAARMAHHVPSDWASDLGERVAGDFIADKTVCDGEAGLAALKALAERLVAQTDYTGGLTLRVVDDPTVNAFAAPGGQVIVFRGLIDTATSPDQVAGVLAHELAHVSENHAMEGIARRIALQFVLLMLLGDVSQLSGAAAGVGGHVLASAYSRDMETEADREAVAMLNASGYTADGLAGFFELLEEQDLGTVPDVLTWLSSHPVHAQRIAAVRRADRGGQPPLPPEAWQALKSVCPD